MALLLERVASRQRAQAPAAAPVAVVEPVAEPEPVKSPLERMREFTAQELREVGWDGRGKEAELNKEILEGLGLGHLYHPTTAPAAVTPVAAPAIQGGDEHERFEISDEDVGEVQPEVARIRGKLRKMSNGRIRSKTIQPKRLTRGELRARDLVVYPEDDYRPRERQDCSKMPRPCPFVSCSHHLYLDVNPESGAIKLNFPHLEVHELAETCSLDVADRGGITLEEVGAILNLTRERIRQVEVRGIATIKNNAGMELGMPPDRGENVYE
jgi:hypothetical protein